MNGRCLSKAATRAIVPPTSADTGPSECKASTISVIFPESMSSGPWITSPMSIARSSGIISYDCKGFCSAFEIALAAPVRSMRGANNQR